MAMYSLTPPPEEFSGIAITFSNSLIIHEAHDHSFTISFLRFLFRFSFHWEDISNSPNGIWSYSKFIKNTARRILNFLLGVCFNMTRPHGPFPSSVVSPFQNESKCETFDMKMSSACRFILMQVRVIFIRKVTHSDSLWNRGTRELGNGPLLRYIRSHTTW